MIAGLVVYALINAGFAIIAFLCIRGVKRVRSFSKQKKIDYQ